MKVHSVLTVPLIVLEWLWKDSENFADFVTDKNIEGKTHEIGNNSYCIKLFVIK